MIATDMPQSAALGPEPLSLPSRCLTVNFREPDMAFIDDATHTGRALYDSPQTQWPSHYYTWAALGTSLLIWAVMIVAVVNPF